MTVFLHGCDLPSAKTVIIAVDFCDIQRHLVIALAQHALRPDLAERFCHAGEDFSGIGRFFDIVGRFLEQHIRQLADTAYRTGSADEVGKALLRLAPLKVQGRAAWRIDLKAAKAGNAQNCRRLLQADRVAQLIQFPPQLFLRHGLFDIAAGVQTHSVPGIFTISRNKNNIDLRLQLLQASRQLKPGHGAHLNIQKGDLAGVFPRPRQGLARLAKRK